VSTWLGTGDAAAIAKRLRSKRQLARAVAKLVYFINSPSLIHHDKRVRLKSQFLYRKDLRRVTCLIEKSFYVGIYRCCEPISREQ
jgi:hypothetical protein